MKLSFDFQHIQYIPFFLLIILLLSKTQLFARLNNLGVTIVKVNY